MLLLDQTLPLPTPFLRLDYPRSPQVQWTRKMTGNCYARFGKCRSNSYFEGEPYSKCPFSNHRSQQRLQLLGYYISVDAVIRDKHRIIVIDDRLKRKITNFSIQKKCIVKKYKEKENHPATFLCC